MTAGWRPPRARVGTVGRAHGLDGAVYVEGTCGWFAFPLGAEVFANGVLHRIRRRAGTDERPLIAFEGVDDRTGAEALRGAPLEVPAESLPQPDDDAYYRFDLVGCEVRQGERLLGRVATVEDGVAHEVLVLDDPAATRLPFVAAIVADVDVAARRLRLADDLVVE